jgi:hypothetical protein
MDGQRWKKTKKVRIRQLFLLAMIDLLINFTSND